CLRVRWRAVRPHRSGRPSLTSGPAGSTGAFMNRKSMRSMTPAVRAVVLGGLSALLTATGVAHDVSVEMHAVKQIREGREAFRANPFVSEAFWGDVLGLHEAIAGEQLGGVGPGVSPKLALEVGLKVDAESLPRSVQRALRRGKLNLDDPAVTL